MSNDLSLAQNHALSLARTLMVPVTLFEVDGQIGVMPSAEYDGDGRCGKGFHSKVKLNLADCAAYALAKNLSAPLLSKGEGFTHTDIEQ